MESADDGPPIVPLPERVDRPLRLGPFPSARDALKFLAYAAVGALLAVTVSPWLGLGVVAIGFGLAVARLDGAPVDRRALAVLRFLVAAAPRRTAVTRGPISALARRGIVTAADGRYVAVVRAGGAPIAYLPPAELARRFDRFRELLRSNPGELIFLASHAPMRAGPVLPEELPPDRVDRAARDGYADLLRLICGRRRVRRVDLAVAASGPGANGIDELEVRTEGLLERLAALDVPARRLRGARLREAVPRVYAPVREEPAG